MDEDLTSVPWRKARRSGDGANCIEVSIVDREEAAKDPNSPEAIALASGAAHKADYDRLYVVRDSKDPEGPRLYFTPAEWEAFRLGVLDGEFDDLAEAE
jgi:hypothetical protein